MAEAGILGFVFKKDKRTDHVSIPPPAEGEAAFLPLPSPAPFHALTFSLTYFALCRKCGKLWYCDSLTREKLTALPFKWVLPEEVSRWYSFGRRIGNMRGLFGMEVKTRGYKTFTLLVDSWPSYQLWLKALREAAASTEVLV